MTREVAEIVRASGCKVIAVNNQAIETKTVNGVVEPPMAPWADILYAADAKWWYHNAEAVAKFKGVKVTIAQNANKETLAGVPEDALFLGHGGMRGFDERPDYLRTGHNSGYQAVHLAIHLGVKRVVLCGFDMNAPKGTKEHWFGDHLWKIGHRSRYDLFLAAFTSVAKEFQARSEIINATLTSALRCFPFMPLKEALDGVQLVRKETRSDGEVRSECQGGVPSVSEAANAGSGRPEAATVGGA